MKLYIRKTKHLCLLAVLLAVFLLAAPSSDAVDGRTPRWQAPVTGPLSVVREFQKPEQKWSPGHRGVDLILPENFMVRSPEAGVITFSGTVVDRQVMTVEHPDGHKSSFEPVTDTLPVGTEVQAGQIIAQLDQEVAHCQPAACLHWGVRQGPDDYVNPLLFLGLADPSVLLPIGDDFAA